MYHNYLVQMARKQLAERKNGLVVRWKKRPAPAPVVPKAQPPKPKAQPPKPKPGVPAIPKPPAAVEHLLNDPTTPDLIGPAAVPPMLSTNQYVVKGFKGGGYARGTAEYQAANVYVTIGETLNYINSVSEVKIPHWRRTNQLAVLPRAGMDLNAFYNGRSLQFFYVNDPRVGAVFAADAADITAHECGHGILDCYRPDLWNAAFLEVGAFHECFGDFCSLMHSLLHDELINRALQETGGDLSKSNVISRLAEQFGKAIYRVAPAGRSPDYLRNAANAFRYVDPGTLPEDAPDDRLAAEVHSFSRILTGALYDIFFVIFKDQKDAGAAPLQAAKVARDYLCRYVMKAVQNAPVNAKFFASVAKTMLWADVTMSNRKYHDRMHEVFVRRDILGVELRMLSALKSDAPDHIVKSESAMDIRLADVTVRAQGVDDNPLYDVEVHVPTGEAHLYDCHGHCCDHVAATEEEAVKGAQDFIEHLHQTRGVGPDARTPWEVRNGKLVRTRTCCF